VIVEDRHLTRADQPVLGDHLALAGAGDDREGAVGLDVQADLSADEPDRHRVAGRGSIRSLADFNAAPRAVR
jgi:hypothetical protein